MSKLTPKLGNCYPEEVEELKLWMQVLVDDMMEINLLQNYEPGPFERNRFFNIMLGVETAWSILTLSIRQRDLENGIKWDGKAEQVEFAEEIKERLSFWGNELFVEGFQRFYLKPFWETLWELEEALFE